MIVRMTEELKQQYEELFAAIKETLVTMGAEGSVTEVNSLPTYYRALDYIIQNDTNNENKNNKFFRIPLDEHPVTINMNTRAIDLGETFKTTGLGVRGDAYAEIVFFEADRYFDTMDLSHCLPIIQWQASTGAVHQEPGILQDATGERDNPDESDKILFGWMPSDEVTKTAGNITFNVRFYAADGSFNVSTQKQTIQVKDTLYREDVDVKMDNPTDILYSRRLFGAAIDSMTGATPYITANLESGIQHLDADTDSLILTVGATSPDGGTIVYEWYKDSIIIHGETENEYLVDVAGTYHARIGNKTDNGTRFLVTPSVYVPAASEIKITSETMPARGYSPNAADSALKYQVKMAVTVENPDFAKQYPAELKYQWFRADEENGTYTAIEGATTNEYVPEIDAEGWYTCEIYNTLNNTQSAVIKPQQATHVRAYPKTMPTPVLTLNGTTITCGWEDNTLPAPAEELKYQWFGTSGAITSGMGEANSSINIAKYATIADTDYYFKCWVSHVVFKGTLEEATGDAGRSLDLNIHVSKDASGKLIYTQN